jgi:hypothetical protein
MSSLYLPKCHLLDGIGWKWMELDGMTISVTMFAKNGHFPSISPSGGHFDSGGKS